jgi:hypothetical protein
MPLALTDDEIQDLIDYARRKFESMVLKKGKRRR